MNDAQHPLDLLAHDVVSPVPPGLLDTARAARRRRVRGRLAVGGAVAAVAVVALAVTLPGGGGSAPVAREDAPRPASTPAAPADTKWVATGGYMVAIPVAWEQTEPPCSDGILTGEGPGFYYLAGDTVMNDCRATGLATSSPTVTLTTSRAGEQDLRCDPTCSQTVEAGGVELRVRDLDSAAAVRAVVDTLQALPASWVVDPVSGRATPYDVTVPKSRLVTDRDRVLGAWRVVQVDGGPVPPGAERGLDVAAL